jgi:hypothetical protein
MIVIAASALLHPDIARANGRDVADRDSRKEKSTRLFVDRDHGRLSGECTKDDPCARITDALAITRAMRYGTDAEIPMLKPGKLIRISVRASPMPYLGSPDPIRLSEDPYLEALPLADWLSTAVYSPNSSFASLAQFGAYAGVFQPVPVAGSLLRTIGYVIHNDLSHNIAIPTLTSGLRMALIGPNLPRGQSAGQFMIKDNHLNENAHGFIIDAGFPFRSSSTEFKGKFGGRFENNEAIGSLTAKALITFTRNNAAETLPGSMAVWNFLVDSRHRVIYSNGEFDETSGPSGRVWIDNPYADPSDSSRALNNQLILAPESFD